MHCSSSPNLSLPASLLLSLTNRPIKRFWMTSYLCTKLPEYRYVMLDVYTWLFWIYALEGISWEWTCRDRGWGGIRWQWKCMYMIYNNVCDGSDNTYGIVTSEFDHTVITLDGGTPGNEGTLYRIGLKWTMWKLIWSCDVSATGGWVSHMYSTICIYAYSAQVF